MILSEIPAALSTANPLSVNQTNALPQRPRHGDRAFLFLNRMIADKMNHFLRILHRMIDYDAEKLYNKINYRLQNPDISFEGF